MPSNPRRSKMCDYCRINLSSSIHIECAQCQDFLLCLQCFSAGKEITGVVGHYNNHSYRVAGDGRLPIFEHGWQAREELLLLEGIKACGFANWSDIAEYIGSKTASECEKHYKTIYLQSPNSLPVTKLNESRQKSSSSSSSSNQQKWPNKKLSAGSGNVVGYSAHRGDYVHEAKNEYEKIFAEMEFKDSDTPLQKELKDKILESYNSVLDYRNERKKFIQDRKLLFSKKQRTEEKELKELYKQLRPFLRFHTQKEHDDLFLKLKMERSMRKQIVNYQDYRRNGIRTSEDMKLFEKWKERREQRMKKQRESSYSFKSTRSRSNTSNKRPVVGMKSRKRKRKTPTMPGYELLSLAEKKLCISLDVTPKEFLRVKNEATFEQSLAKSVSLGFFSKLLEGEKAGRLYNHFVQAGWITPSSDGSSEQLPFSFGDHDSAEDNSAPQTPSFAALS